MYMYAFHSDNFVPLVFRPVLILINVHKVVEVEWGEQGRVGWGGVRRAEGKLPGDHCRTS